MTYPHAIVIAAALLAGAILLSEGTAATSSGYVAISTASTGINTWVARADGAVRRCNPNFEGPDICQPWILP